MVRNVVTPATTSARIVPPCSVILKKRSMGEWWLILPVG
jgi:hypothetical protein